MSKWSLAGLGLGLLGLLFGFAGEALGAKGQKEELIEELKEDYVLVPKIKDGE